MPRPLPIVPLASNYDQRLSTFGTRGDLSPTKQLFATCGFVQNGAIVECPNCGRCANVDLNAVWNPRDIMSIHSNSCTFGLSAMEYIRIRAIFIRTRHVKGVSILSQEVVLRVADMGFSNEIIINATVQFVHDYGNIYTTNQEKSGKGGYPGILDISDIVDYILR